MICLKNVSINKKKKICMECIFKYFQIATTHTKLMFSFLFYKIFYERLFYHLKRVKLYT